LSTVGKAGNFGQGFFAVKIQRVGVGRSKGKKNAAQFSNKLERKIGAGVRLFDEVREGKAIGKAVGKNEDI